MSWKRRDIQECFNAAKNELAENSLWLTDELELKYRIWVARYGLTGADRPDYDGSYVMWQYTNQGSVPGVDAYVDLDMAYFGYSNTAFAQQEGLRNMWKRIRRWA